MRRPGPVTALQSPVHRSRASVFHVKHTWNRTRTKRRCRAFQVDLFDQERSVELRGEAISGFLRFDNQLSSKRRTGRCGTRRWLPETICRRQGSSKSHPGRHPIENDAVANRGSWTAADAQTGMSRVAIPASVVSIWSNELDVSVRVSRETSSFAATRRHWRREGESRLQTSAQ